MDELTEAAARESVRRAATSAGEWIAGLRPWDLFGTLTYDPDRCAKQWTTFGWDQVPRPVSNHQAERDFFGWINDVCGSLGRPIEFVAALEYQKNGWPHFHALLHVGGLTDGDAGRIRWLWNRRHGYVRLEPPRSVANCAAYVSKHIGDDLSKGDILFSKGISQPRPRPLADGSLT